MIICSYYTKNTPYESVANEFIIPTVKKFNLPHEIISINDLGDWNKNTGYKATFCKETLLKYKEPICFLDSDAEIVKYPQVLFDIPNTFDIGYFHFNWSKHWRNIDNPNEKLQLLSGTLWFNYNNNVLNIIQQWIDNVNLDHRHWEQKILEDIVSGSNLNIYKLPAEYCCVIMQNNKLPNYITDPVIIHHQASRKLKNRQNWTT